MQAGHEYRGQAAGATHVWVRFADRSAGGSSSMMFCLTMPPARLVLMSVVLAEAPRVGKPARGRSEQQVLGRNR